MDGSTRFQIAIVALLVTLIVATVMNTCAVDRLERQVIRTAKGLERLEAGGGTASAALPAERGTPGEPSPVQVVGWGGRRAALTWVEGAAEGAPLTLSSKPLPQGDQFVRLRRSAPGTLNTFVTDDAEAWHVTGYVLGSLLEVDPDHPPAVQPGLATRWEVSPDGLTVTWNLRRGVQFADGRPFTSADVRFTYDVVRDPAVDAAHRRSLLNDVASLDTPDDHTVVVRFSRRYWKGIYGVGSALRILDKAWYEEQIPLFAAALGVEAWSTEPGKPGFAEVFNQIRVPGPGTGPYTYQAESYEPGQDVELVQNPFYWGIQVRPRWYNVARYRVRYVGDAVAAAEEFRKGNADTLVVDFQAWDDEYSKDPTLTGHARFYEYDHTGLGYTFIAWNNRRPPFDDPRVRRAMTQLVDRRWLVETIERGRGRVATCPNKPGYPSYPDVEPLPYDVDAARALLDEAGWTDSDGDGIRDRDGKAFRVELGLPASRRFYTQLAGQLQSAARTAGIDLSWRVVEWATFLEDLGGRRFDGLALFFTFDDPWIDPYNEFHSSQDVPGGNNFAGWHDARADRLLDEMREELDDGRRDELFREFCGVFQEEQPMTLVHHGLVGLLVDDRFEGLAPKPTGIDIQDAWVDPANRRYR